MDIILLFQSSRNKSWRDKLSGIYRYAHERRWGVQVVNAPVSARDIRQAIKEWDPLGCLVDRSLEKSAVPDWAFGSTPVIYLDQVRSRPSRTNPCLMHNSASTVRLAAKELMSIGCASFAYMSTDSHYHWDAERHDAFKLEVGKTNLPFVDLKKKGLGATLKSLPKPCGVLAAYDLCALDVYHAATAAGLSVPGDVAIVGIDNDTLFCESVSPGITSVEPNFTGAGYRMAQMLDEEIRMGEAARNRRRIPPLEEYGPLRIVRRGSTCMRMRADAKAQKAVDFIRGHACDIRMKIDDVLSVMGCSRRMATMRFRRATGHSILDEIHEQRFTRMCDLLSNTGWPIATVIAQSGYVSSSFAQKMFKARTGLTMLAWRRLRPKCGKAGCVGSWSSQRRTQIPSKT